MNSNPVFHRTTKAHALDRCLSGIESTDDWAVAQNWRYDHRVDSRREGHLLKNLQRPLVADSLKPAYTTYYRTWISCHERMPIYVAPANASNSVGRMPPQLLVHVISFSSYALIEALNEFSVFFMGIRRGIDWSNWLEKELPPLLNDEELQADILSSLNQWLQKPDCPQRPRWVSFSRSVGDALADTSWPDRVADALGLAHIGQNEWILLLEFPIEFAVNLHRPTSIEAGWYWAHFPSPPGVAWGLTMDFSNSKSGAPRPELIASPTPIPLDATRIRIGRTQFARSGGPRSVRKKHHDRLKREYGSTRIKTWMPAT